jgi:hypothetical protein
MARDPILFINSFINLRDPEGAGNVRGPKIDVSLVHLHRAVAARFHGYIYSDALPGRRFSRAYRLAVVQAKKKTDGC